MDFKTILIGTNYRFGEEALVWKSSLYTHLIFMLLSFVYIHRSLLFDWIQRKQPKSWNNSLLIQIDDLYEFSSFTQLSPLLIFMELLIGSDDISMELSLINHMVFFIGSIEMPLAYVSDNNETFAHFLREPGNFLHLFLFLFMNYWRCSLIFHAISFPFFAFQLNERNQQQQHIIPMTPYKLKRLHRIHASLKFRSPSEQQN